MEKRLIATAVAALALLAPAPTSALPDRWSTMTKLAHAAFPEHCSPVEVVEGAEIPAPLPATAVAWAESPLRGHRACRITLSESFPRYGFADQCSFIVHEYGHLAGLGHSEDPASVMYPSAATYPACATWRKSIKENR